MRQTLPILVLLGNLPLSLAQAQTPETPVRVVVDTLYGTPVSDTYRWLEDAASEEVAEWFRVQGTYARTTLDAMPGRRAILERIREIGAAAPPDVSVPREAGGRWFYTIRRAGEPVARGYVRDAGTGEERLLVDPATIGGGGEAGANTIASFLPSPDGRLVLYGVAAGGSENVVLRVRDVETGQDVEGPMDRNRWDYNVWSPDGRAVFYVRMRDVPAGAPPTEVYRGIEILRHRMGADAASDDAVFSPAIVGHNDRLFPFLEVDPRSGHAFGILTNGVDPHVLAFYVAPVADLARGAPSWHPLFSFADSVGSVAVHGQHLYARTRKDAPLGRIVRTRLDAPELATAETVLAEGEGNIEDMQAALDGLYVKLFSDGVNHILRIPWGDSPIPVALPPETSVGALRTSPLRSGAFLMLDSWTAVSRAYRYDPSTDALEELPLREPGPYDHLDGFVAETVFAPSHDGVRVPLTIVRPEHVALDGSLPVLLTGYGAYGRTDLPLHRAERSPWYESGGAFANCHVRGGGYSGAAWHEAGRKATKPNTWLDFIACAEYLVREGYTRPERLVALGASAGGITVGRAITERPDLFSAAIIQNGAFDLVRFETTPGGPANTQEFGSVTTEAGFGALLEMSAMHHVEPGTGYPAVLLTTGLNDPRVPPWQSGKMAAALQAATVGERPVLLRVDEAAGHMPGTFTDDLIRQLMTDEFAFAMAQAGMPAYQAPAKGDR